MREQISNREKWLHVRLTAAEYQRINMGFKNSTKRKLSQYVRSILLDKQITIYTSNRSYDDIVAEIILLRNELNAIGNNFNQAVKKLHTMKHEAEIKTWVLVNENSKQLFFKKVEEIKFKIAQISDKYSLE